MDFNPIDVQKALKGADYPSSGEDLAAKAQENGAPDDLVEQLRGLGGGDISGPEQVMKHLAK
jgi:hypothetical protein